MRDNGIGLPGEIERKLGLELAQTLVTDDLHGEIQFNRLPDGAEICIRLPRAAERSERGSEGSTFETHDMKADSIGNQAC